MDGCSCRLWRKGSRSRPSSVQRARVGAQGVAGLPRTEVTQRTRRSPSTQKTGSCSTWTRDGSDSAPAFGSRNCSKTRAVPMLVTCPFAALALAVAPCLVRPHLCSAPLPKSRAPALSHESDWRILIRFKIYKTLGQAFASNSSRRAWDPMMLWVSAKDA